MYKMVVESLDKPLVRREAPALEPGDLEVVIGVKAIGCNFFDILIAKGQYQVKPPLPFSPGAEVAGEVLKVGKGVTAHKSGDRVSALIDYGGYASEVVANAATIFSIPEGMDFEHAAGLGIVYQTSYFALKKRTEIKKGETLLVHAAAGGVGLAAVQIGKALGARVIGTAGSQAKFDVVKDNGADEVINYRDDDWVDQVKELTGGRGADVIYDPVGGDIFDLSTKCIAFEGRLLVIGFAGGRIPSIALNRVLLKNIAVIGLHWGLYTKLDPVQIPLIQKELFSMYTEGKIKPLVSATYPLDDAVKALEHLGDRKTVGKIILLP